MANWREYPMTDVLSRFKMLEETAVFRSTGHSASTIGLHTLSGRTTIGGVNFNTHVTGYEEDAMEVDDAEEEGV